MQTEQQLSLKQLHEVVAAIYAQGPVIVREAYSEFGCATREFADAKALCDELHHEPGSAVSRSYTLYYPEAKGHTYERRIALDPKACRGHTFRFCQEGWGLIQLQCDFRKHPRVECRVAVNSKARASLWSVTYPELRSPDLWDWMVVQRKAGKLVRLLRRLAKESRGRSK